MEFFFLFRIFSTNSSYSENNFDYRMYIVAILTASLSKQLKTFKIVKKYWLIVFEVPTAVTLKPSSSGTA
jgi:hypothetical protein